MRIGCQVGKPRNLLERWLLRLLVTEVWAHGLGQQRRLLVAAWDPRQDEHPDRGEDDGSRRELSTADRLSDEQPAEQDGHGRIDVRVRRDQNARCAAPQEPAVGRERDDGAEDHEEAEGSHGVGRDRSRMDAPELSHRGSCDGEESSCAEHLHRGREKRRRRQRRDACVGGAGGPRERRTKDHGGADGVDVCALSDEQRDSEQPRRDPGERAEREPDPEEGAVEERREQRDGCDEKGGEPGGDPLLRPRDPAGIDEQQQPADHGRGHPLAPSGLCHPDVAAPRGPGVEKTAGQREAHREHEQRRQRPVGDRDREIRRSPDDVDDQQRSGNLRSHDSMVPSARDQHKLSYRSFRS